MKKRLQAALMAAVVLVSALVWAPPAHAVGTVTVSQVSGTVGEMVDVTISLTSDDVASGNFDVRYDSAALELVQAQATNEFNCFANPYGDGRVRVSFARLEAIAQARLCTLTFRVSADTSADGSAVMLEQVRLYSANSDMVGAEVIHGSVERKTVRLSMKPVNTAMYQAVGAVVELGGTLAPAGGNFSISYDPDCFEVKSVLALEAMGGAIWQYNVVEPGLVKVSFSNATALKAGPLCSVVFQSIGNAGSGSELTISDARMYGEDQNAMDVSVVNGSLNIVVPSDDDPKLWVVGGAMENGSATAAVVLQGRGYACGGNFTMTYDKGMTATVQTIADCQINHDAVNGTIRVSWAAATPYSGEAEMLRITFENAVESTVEIENVTLYCAESEAIPVVDVRPGKISTAETVTAVVDETVVETVGEQSTYTVAVDVADMNYFTDTAVESITPVLALYEEGRMVGLEMQTVSDFRAGVSEIELSAQTDKDVDGISVFLLESAEDMIPLTAALDAGVVTE